MKEEKKELIGYEKISKLTSLNDFEEDMWELIKLDVAHNLKIYMNAVFERGFNFVSKN